jgi:actin-related protein
MTIVELFSLDAVRGSGEETIRNNTIANKQSRIYINKHINNTQITHNTQIKLTQYINQHINKVA